MNTPMLNGHAIDPERLRENAAALFEALTKIAAAPDIEDARDIARHMLAPCHWVDFEVPTYGIANTEPEEMTAEAFAAWVTTIPADRRNLLAARRWIYAEENGYVSAIRNNEKRMYAAEYLRFLRGKRPDSPRAEAARLSLMAAQAVRLRLDAIHTKLDREALATAPQPPAVPAQPLLMPLDPFTQPEML